MTEEDVRGGGGGGSGHIVSRSERWSSIYEVGVILMSHRIVSIGCDNPWHAVIAQ